jgi:hypothetical protein
MGNTVTNTRLFCGNSKVVQYITIASDGTEESDTVVYDSSAVATVLGLSDTSNCKIREIVGYVSAASTARVSLEFDANTDVLAFNIPANVNVSECFDHVGGLKNTSSTGKTGDITLTTTGLESGDSITLLLVIDPR